MSKDDNPGTNADNTSATTTPADLANPADNILFNSGLRVSELNLTDPIGRVEILYQLWRSYADFHIYLVKPALAPISPPLVIPPEPLSEGEGLEKVYTIYDFGFKLSTSKAEDMYSSGMSMYRMYNTIEKMIAILVDRVMSQDGITSETEVQISFVGHELCQRKGFEVTINLPHNFVVTNFDPGEWGNWYLKMVKSMGERFGYPSQSPRDTYKKLPHVFLKKNAKSS